MFKISFELRWDAKCLLTQKREIKALHNVGVLLYDSAQKDSALIYFLDGERKASALGLKQL